MGGLFQNKYKINSPRLRVWDYSSPGYYFVTLCADERKIFFGQIKDKEVVLSEIGKVVDKFWLEITKHFNNIALDEYIIMPNHLHGIILIKSVELNFDYFPQTMNFRDIPRRDKACLVSTNRWQNPGKNTISTIIGSFKSACSREINRQSPNLNFNWQPLFYDHVIRSAEELSNVRNYILNNPHNWPCDRNNPRNF